MPGVADDEHRAAHAGRLASVEERAQPATFRDATHEVADDRRSGRGIAAQPDLALECVQPDRLGLSAQDERTAIRDHQAPSSGAHGGRVEQDLRRSGEGLDPGRRRDRRPGQRQVLAGRVGPGRDDLAGRDPDPDLHRVRPVAQVAQRRPDRQGGEGRADRVVVVGPWPAEDREDRVTDELLARPVEPFDGVGHRGEGRADAAPNDLGIVLRDHPDVVDEIGEEGRDDPSVAVVVGGRRGSRRRFDRAERRSALIAEPRPDRPGRVARTASHVGPTPLSARSDVAV